MTKKYELTNETITFEGHTLYRIRALKNFKDVNRGDLGGYVESERNLSQERNCWVYDNAKILDNAMVCDDAKVSGNARMHHRSKAMAKARISGDAHIYGEAWIDGDAQVYDSACVSGTIIYNGAVVCGNAFLNYDGTVAHTIKLESARDYITFEHIGRSDEHNAMHLAMFKCADDSVYVKWGMFSGTLDEFESHINSTLPDENDKHEYMCTIELARTHFGLSK